MDWSSYASFLLLAVLLVLVPGADFAVVTKNTLVSGKRRGRWSAAGVATAAAVQGCAAAAGLGALLVKSEPVFQTIKWAGVAYLVYLGVQSLRSARAGTYSGLDNDAARIPGGAFAGWRQGFLSNITNPKVLVFYVAVLPQFLGGDAAIGVLLAYALSHAVISFLYLVLLASALHRARRVLSRPNVRRSLDAFTGVALVGFGVRVAAEHG